VQEHLKFESLKREGGETLQDDGEKKGERRTRKPLLLVHNNYTLEL
jgi:hypothetical protein